MSVLGFDVSVWQDQNSTPQQINFAKAKQEGIKFAFIKASESIYLDEDFTYNWNTCKQAGIPRGAYHYFRFGVSEIQQARFLAGILTKDSGELPVVVDFEYRDFVSKKPPSNSIIYLWSFIKELERQLPNKSIMIYTGYYYWQEAVQSTNMTNIDLNAFKQYGLWEAWYGNNPLTPKPWDKITVWQYTDKGDGLKYGCESLSVDMNYFMGTDNEFSVWSKQVNIPVPVEKTDKEKLDILWQDYISRQK
jgi:lysozyme